MCDEKRIIACPKCGVRLDPNKILDPIDGHYGAYRLEGTYGFFGGRDFVFVDFDAPISNGDIIAVEKDGCNLIVRYVNAKRHNNAPSEHYVLYPIFGEPFDLDESVSILGKVFSIAVNMLDGERS